MHLKRQLSFLRRVKPLLDGKLMLDHAFKFVDTVVFWVGDTNIVSMRAMEKIGGVKRDQVIGRVLGGINYPHIIYEIRKP